MKPMTVLGILLAALGILVLVFQGFSYTHREKVIDLGPIHATRDDTERVPIPPLVGGLALLGGTALLVMGAKRKA